MDTHLNNITADAVVVASVSTKTRANMDHAPRVSGADIVRALDGRWYGKSGKARCPAHHDTNASLNVDKKDGKTLVWCGGGCSQEQVLASLADLGLWHNGEESQRPVYHGTNGSGTKNYQPIIPVPHDAPEMSFKHPELGKPAASWPYHAIDGARVGYIARFNTVDKNGKPDKTFLPITYCDLDEGKRGWRSRGIPEPRPLYRLPRIVAKTNVPILVTEGEKAADAAQRLFPNFVVTTTMHGAKSPTKSDWSPTSGRQVVIWPDADEAGRKFAGTVAGLARAAGAVDVRIVEVPTLFPKGWDLADQPPEGWTVDQLRELLKPKTNGSGGTAAHHEQATNDDGTVVLGGIEKLVTTLDQLNQEYALLEMPGQRAAIILRTDASPITQDDFVLRLSDKVVKSVITDKNGTRVKYISATKFWRESTRKHRYRKIAFTSKTVPEDCMNLFCGFGVTPKPGNCDKILQHISEVICSGNEKDFNAMIDLIAWQIQNIGIASRIIVDLISDDEQTGKGTILEGVLKKIFGRAGYMTPRIEDITGPFNEVLRGKAFLVLDEALFAGDKAGANQIKGYAATKEIPISAKFLPNLTVPSGLNIWTLSNEKVPMHIGEKDARHWSLSISPHRKDDFVYWDALHREIENGGCEAFLYHMLNQDVSNFRPQRDIPRNNEVHTDIALRSLAPSDPRNWLLESIECDRLIHVKETKQIIDDLGRQRDIEVELPWREGAEVGPRVLLAGYQEWVRGLRGYGIKTVSINDFWKELTNAGFVCDRTKSKRERVVPSSESCKEMIKASVCRS